MMMLVMVMVMVVMMVMMVMMVMVILAKNLKHPLVHLLDRHPAAKDQSHCKIPDDICLFKMKNAFWWISV